MPRTVVVQLGPARCVDVDCEDNRHRPLVGGRFCPAHASGQRWPASPTRPVTPTEHRVVLRRLYSKCLDRSLSLRCTLVFGAAGPAASTASAGREYPIGAIRVFRNACFIALSLSLLVDFFGGRGLTYYGEGPILRPPVRFGSTAVLLELSTLNMLRTSDAAP